MRRSGGPLPAMRVPTLEDASPVVERYLGLGLDSDALFLAEHVHAGNPSGVGELELLARCAAAAGQHQRVISLLQGAEQPVLRYLLALSALKTGDPAAAERALLKVRAAA